MTYPPLQAQVVLPQVISSMFNTISGKKIAMFGFAFKKDTGDTRETSSMYIARELLEERCLLTIQDEQVPVASRVLRFLHPLVQVTSELIRADMSEVCSNLGVTPDLDALLTTCECPYEAAQDAHAILICTEWDQYKTLDYQRIFDSMKRPAYIFDGRRMVNAEALQQIGFKTYVIGQPDLVRLGLKALA